VGRIATCGALSLVLASAAVASPPPGVAPAATAETHFHAGERIAETLSIATGVPISPLLGVSALGAWRWWRTPAAARPALPWYASPWFWGSGAALALLFALNTTIGALVPGLKKPMDFVEEHENKLSAVVATPVVLLEVHRALALAGVLPRAADAALGGAGPLATATLADGGAAWRLLVSIGLGAIYLTVFAVVFFAFHALQVLIALSPSTILDLMLRGFRLSMLAAAAAASAAHPYLGAAYAAVLLLACALIAGWSFRLTVYGSVLSWDFLSGRAGAADPSSAPLLAFAGKGLAGPPLRSLGRIEPTPLGGWCFRWRPWLILPSRRVDLDAPSKTAIVRGALSPRLVRTGVREATLGRFPPRFRGREAGLADRLGAADVLDGRIVRGFRAAWRAMREFVSIGETSGPADLPPALPPGRP
jgi:hypothetical protein